MLNTVSIKILSSKYYDTLPFKSQNTITILSWSTLSVCFNDIKSNDIAIIFATQTENVWFSFKHEE